MIIKINATDRTASSKSKKVVQMSLRSAGKVLFLIQERGFSITVPLYFFPILKIASFILFAAGLSAVMKL